MLHAVAVDMDYGERWFSPPVIEQVAKEVTDFSSQYGSETSISYTACNLAGRSNIYPNYGDFTQACVFRTYGPWWNIAPSKKRKFKRSSPSFCSEDYIELSFDKKVYPSRIDIFETYNPGTVVRILACDTGSGTDVDTGFVIWQTLWEGPPVATLPEPRTFSPPLNKAKFATDLICLEFCHKHCNYYTELDCVILYGTKAGPSSSSKSETALIHDNKKVNSDVDAAADKLKNLAINALTNGPILSETDHQKIQHYSLASLLDTNLELENDLQFVQVAKSSHIREDCDLKTDIVTDEPFESVSTADICPACTNHVVCDSCRGYQSECGYFDLLPEEVTQLILVYLDTPSLCRAAQTCSLLRKHCYDRLHYTELNLQPHWTRINNTALDGLHSRCRYLQNLNLSWCGNSGHITNVGLSRFLDVCGENLTCLYLSCCPFVTSTTLDNVGNMCKNLKELDLQSCRRIDNVGILQIIKLKQLQYLNLYRTLVDTHSVLDVIRSCHHLKHLNLGSCTRIDHYDEVTIELGNHCKNLKSLDLWRARTITEIGLRALANNCPELEELDVGWCPELRSTTNCFTYLVEKCKKMKKLFLTANRTVCDADLFAIAEHSTLMEQLDILGTRQVSQEASVKVLKSCQQLRMFDVSFCAGIDHQTYVNWSKEFPHVAIKKSFQN